jgi:hypothetical protein
MSIDFEPAPQPSPGGRTYEVKTYGCQMNGSAARPLRVTTDRATNVEIR